MLCSSSGPLHGQGADSTFPIVMAGIKGGIHFPGGDLADRFGKSGMVGIELAYKSETQWYIGVGLDLILGDEVKEDVLANITNANGFLIQSDGLLFEPRMNQRGYQCYAEFGRVFNMAPSSPQSGWLVTLGLGFIQHKIQFDIDNEEKLPQLSKTMQKGYDRLTNGWFISQFLGYQHFSVNKLINFKVGIAFTQAFTKNRRDIDFSTGIKDNRSRLDILFGPELQWILPFYKTKDYY